MRFDIEQLLAAAVQVGGHGEELAARHLTADNRLEAATPGWAGRSAAALGGRAELWRGQSSRLVSRFGAHATDLHSTALGFAAMEQRNSAALGVPSSPTTGAPAVTAIR
jgi:uncharacterized protein YukE